MYQNDVATPACITADIILEHFSKLLYGDTPPPSIASVFQAIDEWWFVPREKKMVRTSHVRAKKAYLTYKARGTVPTYVVQAHAWSFSHQLGRAVTAEDVAKSIQ